MRRQRQPQPTQGSAKETAAGSNLADSSRRPAIAASLPGEHQWRNLGVPSPADPPDSASGAPEAFSSLMDSAASQVAGKPGSPTRAGQLAMLSSRAGGSPTGTAPAAAAANPRAPAAASAPLTSSAQSAGKDGSASVTSSDTPDPAEVVSRFASPATGSVVSSTSAVSDESSQTFSEPDLHNSACTQAVTAVNALGDTVSPFALAGGPLDRMLPALAGMHMLSDEDLLRLQRTMLIALENERHDLMAFYSAETLRLRQVMTLQRKQNLLRLRSETYNPLEDPTLAHLYRAPRAGVPMGISEFVPVPRSMASLPSVPSGTSSPLPASLSGPSLPSAGVPFSAASGTASLAAAASMGAAAIGAPATAAGPPSDDHTLSSN